MKFHSPTDKPIYLGLTSGHTHVIGPVDEEVPEHFHRMAVAEGAIPEGMKSMPPAELSPTTKPALILAGIKKMLEGNTEGDFTNDGKPNAQRLSAIVGFTVLSGERDDAWQAAQDETDA